MNCPFATKETRASAGCALLVLVSALVAGCRTPCECPTISELPTRRPNPLIYGVGRWMEARHYMCTTNQGLCGCEISACFAEKVGQGPSCECVFTTNPGRDTLCATAIFSPAVPRGKEATAVAWVISANSDLLWGCYGVDLQSRQLWFRVAFFHPDGRVREEDLDRMLSEALGAWCQAHQSLLGQEEIPVPPPPPAEDEPTAKSAPMVHGYVIALDTHCAFTDVVVMTAAASRERPA